MCSSSSGRHLINLFDHQGETCEHWGKHLKCKCIIFEGVKGNVRHYSGSILKWYCLTQVFCLLSISLSLCTDNYIAPWFLRYKLQPIHTNLLNSAGSGKGKWTTTVHLQATQWQRLEDFIPFRLFKLSLLHLFLNLLFYTLQEAFHLIPDIWFMESEAQVGAFALDCLEMKIS